MSKILITAFFFVSLCCYGSDGDSDDHRLCGHACALSGFIEGDFSWGLVCLIPPYTRKEDFLYEEKKLENIDVSDESIWSLVFYDGGRLVSELRIDRRVLDYTPAGGIRCQKRGDARFSVSGAGYFELHGEL